MENTMFSLYYKLPTSDLLQWVIFIQFFRIRFQTPTGYYGDMTLFLGGKGFVKFRIWIVIYI